MDDPKPVFTKTRFRDRPDESCEICFAPIKAGLAMCDRCLDDHHAQRTYREDMLDAGRGHLLG